MPVYTNYSQLPNGQIWVSMLISCPAANVKTTITDVVPSVDKAKSYLVKQIMKYWNKQVIDFISSRRMALQEVGMLSTTHLECINKIVAANSIANNYPVDKHFRWCLSMLQAQDYIFFLLPSVGSRHRNWRHRMYEMLSYCYESIKDKGYDNLKPQFNP